MDNPVPPDGASYALVHGKQADPRRRLVRRCQRQSDKRFQQVGIHRDVSVGGVLGKGEIGLGVAVEYALSWGLPSIEDRITELTDHLRERLVSVDGVRVHDQGSRRCGIVTFTLDHVPASQVQQLLSDRGTNVSVSIAEYARLDLPKRGLTEIVRASVHYYNTHDELDRLVNALATAR